MTNIYNEDFLGKTNSFNHYVVVNTKPKNHMIFLDLATNREIVFINEEPRSARQVNHSRAERSFNLALEGSDGYQIENFTSDEYEKFNELYSKMTVV